jgi:hypothetical protein
MNAISPGQIELDPIEIDPRPCGECGRTIDQHRRVDTPEGPEFFCADLSPDDMTLDELERREELRRQEDLAGILERISAPIVSDDRPRDYVPTYRTPQSTIDAFRYVVRLGDPGYFTRWLAQHPLDAPALYKLYEGKNARA